LTIFDCTELQSVISMLDMPRSLLLCAIGQQYYYYFLHFYFILFYLFIYLFFYFYYYIFGLYDPMTFKHVLRCLCRKFLSSVKSPQPAFNGTDLLTPSVQTSCMTLWP